jgi:hypothetical protein
MEGFLVLKNPQLSIEGEVGLLEDAKKKTAIMAQLLAYNTSLPEKTI